MGFLTDCMHLGLSLLGDKMERRLGQRGSEIERLRCQLDSERRDLDEARRKATSTAEIIEMQRRRIEELEALLSRLTPRTYRAGAPKPQRPIWWEEDTWTAANWLDPGDIYLDLPPPDAWPQPWTGSSGPLDQEQQGWADALQKVTQERDDLTRALHAAVVRLGKEHGALERERDEARREATEIAATLADVAKAKVAAEDAYCEAQETLRAAEEGAVDRRVADLLRRCGPMSAKALGKHLGVSHHVTRASVQRLKCTQEGSGSMTRWRLPENAKCH